MYRTLLGTLYLLLSLFLSAIVDACTVPVFRYALDNWQGESDPNTENSAVHNQIADAILAGNAAVWVQIDSGSKEVDDETFERLESRLKFFQSVAELPEIDPNDPSSRIGPGPPLELKFTAIRIPRGDAVVNQIAGERLASLPKDEPWIAPVFGRGRVLGCWEASLMDEEGIDEACHYLTGACSCQVKLQNPGWDLPMNIEWQERLFAVANGESEPASADRFNDLKTEEVEELVTEIVPTPSVNHKTNYLLLGIGIAILVIGVGLLFRRGKSKSS